MCQYCFDEYTPHTQPPTTAKIRHVANLIADVYEFSTVGGSLHVILDDWNLEDEHFPFTEAWIEKNAAENGPAQVAAERACLAALKPMTLGERAVSLATYWGFVL